MKYLFTFLFLFSILILKGQTVLKKSINKDSLVNVLTKDLPLDLKTNFLNEYHSASDTVKEYILYILSMPRSSKKLMVANIDSNYQKIILLKTEYTKLVPKNCEVSIEFNQGNQDFNEKESIDLRIAMTENNERKVSQDWNMLWGSPKLDSMIKSVGWNYNTLNGIKKLLREVKCISIENGSGCIIGYARSGLGKYSYLLFDNELNAEQVKQYNDGCNFIFYKKNIVLEYEGGAAGPQCFPDKNN